MIPFERCPVCGGEVVRKRTEKLLPGGDHLATVTDEAEVCLHCGERMYSTDMIRSFDRARGKPGQQQVEGFKPLGRSFRVPL